MANYKPGDKATCKMCGKEITYVGPHWDHVGPKPRHPAIPKGEVFVGQEEAAAPEHKRMIITLSGIAAGTESFGDQFSRFNRIMMEVFWGLFPDFKPDHPPMTITTIDNLEYQDYAALLHRLVNLPMEKVEEIFKLVEQANGQEVQG